jgi:hypothetical protein
LVHVVEFNGEIKVNLYTKDVLIKSSSCGQYFCPALKYLPVANKSRIRLTITRELKEEVIRLSNEGKGRNEIARLLTGQISEGSVGNIIRAYCKKSYDTTQKHASVNDSQVNDMVEQGSLTRVTTFHEEKDISIENRTHDFEENGYPLENSQKGGPLSWFVSNSDTKSEASIRQTRSSDPPTTVNSTKNKSLPRSTFVKASPSDKSLPQSTSMKTIAAGQQQQQPVANIGDVLEPEDLSLEPEELKSVPDPKPRFVQDEIERELKIEGGRAWQFYGAAQTRILSQIAKAKDQRRHDLLVIDRRKQKLSEWSKRLEQMQYDLTVRERELEAYLGLAKKLQEMGLTLDDAMPWFETITQVAQMEKLDTKSASIYVSQELVLNRQLSGIRGQIEIAQGRLQMLNIVSAQKQHALTIIEDLVKRGVTEQQIAKLVEFAGEWDKYWRATPNSNLQQPNNGNGKIPSSLVNPQQLGNSNNPGPGSISVNNLIRLNMLKTNTTNMLNRMGA